MRKIANYTIFTDSKEVVTIDNIFDYLDALMEDLCRPDDVEFDCKPQEAKDDGVQENSWEDMILNGLDKSANNL